MSDRHPIPDFEPFPEYARAYDVTIRYVDGTTFVRHMECRFALDPEVLGRLVVGMCVRRPQRSGLPLDVTADELSVVAIAETPPRRPGR